MTLVLCPRCAKRMTDSDLCLSCRLEGFDATRPTPAELFAMALADNARREAKRKDEQLRQFADHGNGD